MQRCRCAAFHNDAAAAAVPHSTAALRTASCARLPGVRGCSQCCVAALRVPRSRPGLFEELAADEHAPDLCTGERVALRCVLVSCTADAACLHAASGRRPAPAPAFSRPLSQRMRSIPRLRCCPAGPAPVPSPRCPPLHRTTWLPQCSRQRNKQAAGANSRAAVRVQAAHSSFHFLLSHLTSLRLTSQPLPPVQPMPGPVLPAQITNRCDAVQCSTHPRCLLRSRTAWRPAAAGLWGTR